MGQPKLLLPLGGKTIIERVLAVLVHPQITARYVVVRKDDLVLQEAVRVAGGTVLLPDVDPSDMRTSVSFALQVIQQQFEPRDDDGWLLVPADHPVLDGGLIEALVSRWTSHRPAILVPRCSGRRGHPTLFRWSLAREVPQIPADHGLNWLLQEHCDSVEELAVESPAALIDLDTPEDYSRLCQSWDSKLPPA